MCFSGKIDDPRALAAQAEQKQLDALSLGAMPDLTDAVVIQAQLQKKRQMAALQGRTSTFLTGPAGIGGPSSEISKAFLMAKVQAQDNPYAAPAKAKPRGVSAPVAAPESGVPLVMSQLKKLFGGG